MGIGGAQSTTDHIVKVKCCSRCAVHDEEAAYCGLVSCSPLLTKRSWSRRTPKISGLHIFNNVSIFEDFPLFQNKNGRNKEKIGKEGKGKGKGKRGRKGRWTE